MPPEDRQDLLLLRLGARGAPADEAMPSRGLRRLSGARKQNARGTTLAYAPHSYRCDAEHVPRWITNCRSMTHSRRGRQAMDEREQHFVAMGYFALIVMRRWRKWAHREAGLRYLFEKLCVRAAVRRWKEAVKLTAFQVLLRRLSVRKALERWKKSVEKRAAVEAARDHHSRNLVSKVWKVWISCRTTAASSHGRLRNGMDQWRAWLRLWKTRVDALRTLMTRRAMASAFRHWRLISSAANDRRRRRLLLQAVVGGQLEVILLRKCFLALAQNAHSATTLRRLVASFRMRTLRGGFEAWQQALPREKPEDQAPPSPTAVVNVITERRRQPGNPRKLHCRCVYAVSRGQRCTCAPRSHLLRRVEELHRLVAQGLDGRQGGYRLLSHVVQRAAPAPSGAATPLPGGGSTHLGELNPSLASGSSRRGYDGALGTPRATIRAQGGGDKGPTKSARPVSGKFRKRSRERGLPVAAGSDVGLAAGTVAAAATSFHMAGAAVRLGAHRTNSLDEEVGPIDCVALAASGGLRSEGIQGLRSRPPPRARAAPRRRDMTHW